MQLEVAEAEAELAADALWQAGPSAVSEVSLGDGRVRLTADPADLADIDPRWPVEVVELDGAAHLDAWRAWARPVRAGRRILLQPAWLPVTDAVDGDVVIVLDPGRAFGSGSHPSTRLVLAALEDADHRRRAGARRGVRQRRPGGGCLPARRRRRPWPSTSIRPRSRPPTPTRSANGVGDRVRRPPVDLADVDGTFDVVVANIGVRVLVDIAPTLVRAVRPGGTLVVAGLLDGQADDVVAACVGAVEVEPSRRGRVGRRSAAPAAD